MTPRLIGLPAHEIATPAPAGHPVPVWLSTDDVAEVLGLNTNTVARLVASHGLPAYRIGRVVRYRLDEVEAWLDQQRVTA